jgi:hypothetical protein
MLLLVLAVVMAEKMKIVMLELLIRRCCTNFYAYSENAACLR